MKILTVPLLVLLPVAEIFSQNVGINIANPTEKLHVGNGTVRIEGPVTPGGNALSIGGYGDVRVDASGVSGGRFIIKENGNVGINNAAPGFPLSFPNALGNKISLWGNSGAHYGLGIQSNLLQIHTDNSTSDIAFGYGSSDLFAETMRVKGNGNVGVGTTAPSEKLDVAGNVKANSYKYPSPKTYYYSVPPCAFQPNDSRHETYSEIHYTYYLTLNTHGHLIAPVYLPHGSTVTSFTFYYFDNSSQADLNVQFRNSEITSIGSGQLATVTTSGVSGNSSLTFNSYSTSVSNQSSSYFILVKSVLDGSDVNWPGSNLRVRNVIITYTLNEAQ